MVDCAIPAYDKSNCAFFALGRNAMYAGCRMLGLEEGDEVLTPAFDCDSALGPFRALGLKTVFYRSEAYTFCVSIGDIRKNITPKTKLLHVINHFGMPQPWDDIRALGRDAGIPILEDDAYSPFSSIGADRFGTFGDIAIFSLRKNLPLVNGGMLKINNPRYKCAEAIRGGKFNCREDVTGILKAAAKGIGLKWLAGHFRQTEYSPPPLYSDRPGYPDSPGRDHIGPDFSSDYMRPISAVALRQLAEFGIEDFEKISDKKRYHYRRLTDGLKDMDGIEVLWPDLPDGAVPFCVSVLIGSRRDAFLEALRDKYDVMAWPTLSMAVIERLRDFPEVELLGRKLFQINLPSEEVVNSVFHGTMDRLIGDIRKLAGG